ncbi:MAG: hypothetical protein IKT79_04415, partial [Akkermansia sp.]|nr:hypothetical protein [Akkermansia sp.]
PLFILSGAPPGRLLKPVSCISAALGASESHTWKIASPGGVKRRTAYSFELPRSGVRGKAYQKHRFTSSSFLEKSLGIFATPALSAAFSYGLEQKKYFFNPRAAVPCSEIWNPARKKPPQP